MSQFVVSARKYRPKEFHEVIGQEPITETLSRAIIAEKIAQAFLFCGPRGVGKTTTARILAKAVNLNKTENLAEESEDFAFNIFELDAASNNKVEDMRNLMEQVRIPPQTGRYKIYIIDEVHMLSSQAFNAFLKTLEEPPPYAIFILATTEKHKILPTILSRCQIFDFKRIDVPSIVQQLKHVAQAEDYKVEDEAYHLIAETADGALRDALSVFDRLVAGLEGNELTQASVLHQLNLLDWSTFAELIESLMLNDHGQAIATFNEIQSQGFEGNTFMQGLAEYLRLLMIAKDARLHHLMIGSAKKISKVSAQAEIATPGFIINALALINDAEISYQKSLNKRLHVEICLMRIAHASQVIHEADTKKKTDDLGSRTAQKAHTEQSSPTPEPKAEVIPPPVDLDSKEIASSPKEDKVEESRDEALIPSVEVTQDNDSAENTSENETIPSSVVSASELPPKKSELGKRLSLDDLDTPDLLKPKDEPTVNPDKEITRISWDGGLASLTAEVHKFLQESDQTSIASILTNLKITQGPDGIFYSATAKAQKDLLEAQIPSVNQYLKKIYSNAPSLKIVFEEADKAQKKGVMQNTKKVAETMDKSNPALRNFIEDLGLEIDYSA